MPIWTKEDFRRSKSKFFATDKPDLRTVNTEDTSPSLLESASSLSSDDNVANAPRQHYKNNTNTTTRRYRMEKGLRKREQRRNYMRKLFAEANKDGQIV